MNNTIKPLTLLREEFIENLVNLCNDSGLPFFAIEDVLKNLAQQTQVAAQQQLAADKENYQKRLEAEKKAAEEKAE
jgi:hypothetical protein